MPQRILKNPFAEKIHGFEVRGASREEIREAFSHKRGFRGSILGDWNHGYFNCGQGAALINDIKPVAKVFEDLLTEFDQARSTLC